MKAPPLKAKVHITLKPGVLDPQGREAWRHLGLADEETIRAALRALHAGKTPPPQQ